MSDEAIPVQIVKNDSTIKFIPFVSDDKWFIGVSRSYKDELIECITVEMDEFLKVCRAFAADAENYK